MSGVYIQGMQMPEPGEHRLILYVDKSGSARIEGLSREYVGEPFDVIPVPDHGDLIDRNALVPDTSFYDGGDWHYGYSKKTIQYAPTVLPADYEVRAKDLPREEDG